MDFLDLFHPLRINLAFDNMIFLDSICFFFQFAKRYYFSCMFFFFLFTSCIPDPIEMELKNQSPKLVVNADLIPGTIPLINLTKTVDLYAVPNQNDTLQSDFLKEIAVSDAFVTISYEADIDTCYMVEPGVYSGRKLLKFSSTPYLLHVKDVHSNTEVNAQTFLLPKIKFDSISPFVFEAPDDTSIYINYGFSDNLTSSDYYVINYYAKKKTIHEVNFDTQHYFQRGYNQLLFYELINKEYFYDHSYVNFAMLPRGITIRDSIAITLSNITEEYYNYLYKRRSWGNIPSLYYFPNYIPTNITNGFGYFSVRDPEVFLSDLK
jgi:hypothetical protein